MTVQRLHSAFAPIDVLTRLDLEAMQHQWLEETMRVKLRGIDYIEQNGNGLGIAQVAVPGPDQGYAWSVKIVSVTVTAAATVSVFLGDNTNSAPVAQTILTAAGSAISTFTSNIVVIRDSRVITLLTSAGGITTYKVLAKQVPNEMVGKL